MVLNPDYKVWMKQHEAGEGGACAADSVDHAGGGSDDGVQMSDAERQLRELERMKNLLTEAEYQQKRSEIIASIGSDGGAGVAMAVAHDPTPVAVATTAAVPVAVAPTNTANGYHHVSPPCIVRLKSNKKCLLTVDTDELVAARLHPGAKVGWLMKEKTEFGQIQHWVYDSVNKTVALGARPDLVLTAPKKKNGAPKDEKSASLQPYHPANAQYQHWSIRNHKKGSTAIVLESHPYKQLSAFDGWSWTKGKVGTYDNTDGCDGDMFWLHDWPANLV